MAKISRREWFKGTAVGLGSWATEGALGPPQASGEAEAVRKDLSSRTPRLQPLNRFPRMVQEYFVSLLRPIEQSADQRRAAIKTKEDAEAYVRQVRQKIRHCFGPWPEKTPLNARISGTIARAGYHIEKLIFESRPNFPVTANVYLPSERRGPSPAVVSPCGHSPQGKGDVESQSFAQTLARQGYVVLVYDPIGQGERLQYVTPQLQPRHGRGTSEHLYAGNQQFLVGEFFGSWRVWDGIRAVDYLLSRPDVDRQHLGITGHSGGGTISTWLVALEPRLTMAAISCFVSTFGRNLENELPADTEQCPPQALALGLDHSDFIAAFAPKPVILLGEERDFFDVRGLEQAHARLKNLYRRLGAETNLQLSIGPGYHSYGKENRQAMYRWFLRATGIQAAATESDISIEEDQTLWCTTHGQVAETNPRTVFSFTRESSVAFKRRRKALSDTELKRALAKILRIKMPEVVPEYRILRPATARNYPKKFAATYAVETEPGISVVTYRLSDEPLESRIPRGKRAILYVSDRSADVELRTEPLIASLIRQEPDSAVFACDVRGIGDSQPATCGAKDFADPYGSDYFYAIHSIMLDRPYVGQRTHDLLSLLMLLESTGSEVHLVGKGWGAIPAIFAALLSAVVVEITLRNAPESYSSIAESEDYDWPLSSFVPGVLEWFDLPDCYRVLAAKRLNQIDPVVGHGSLLR